MAPPATAATPCTPANTPYAVARGTPPRPPRDPAVRRPPPARRHEVGDERLDRRVLDPRRRTPQRDAHHADPGGAGEGEHGHGGDEHREAQQDAAAQPFVEPS